MTGVYIHIPFCKKKCAYCDFLSFETTDYEIYVKNLINEIKSARFNNKINTIYIGGGTPTVLPPVLLREILQAFEHLPIQNAEITVEANPGTVNYEYLKMLKTHGVNRLSFGLQAIQTNLLNTLGRIQMEFTENFYSARETGFKNINIDLMFALPNQQINDWRETLTSVIALSPEHISAYSLTPAENTPLNEKLKNAELFLPSEETDREMYHEARKILAEAGYAQYEISNFAKPGYESRHNINCWQMKPYIGFGLGAHSFDGKTRWQNAEDFQKYFNNEKIILSELSAEDIISETMILGLRLTRGINENKFAKKFGAPPHEIFNIEKLIKNGLLARSDNRIFLTPRGMDLANHVFCEFLNN